MKPPKRGRQGEGGGRPVKWDAVSLDAMADDLLEWMEGDHTRIFVKKFAIERRFSPQRFTEWCEKSEKFSEVYDIVKAIAETRLAEGGLTAEFNPYFAGLSLKNVAGWRDREPQKVDVSSEGGNVSISIDV